jgi:hypothetical protein
MGYQGLVTEEILPHNSWTPCGVDLPISQCFELQKLKCRLDTHKRKSEEELSTALSNNSFGQVWPYHLERQTKTFLSESDLDFVSTETLAIKVLKFKSSWSLRSQRNEQEKCLSLLGKLASYLRDSKYHILGPRAGNSFLDTC